MRLTKVSAACYGLGLFIGGAASVGLAFGFAPSRLPAALLDVAAYKLAFLTSIALFGVGAAVGRYAQAVRRSREEAAEFAEEAAALTQPRPADDLTRSTSSRDRDRA